MATTRRRRESDIREQGVGSPRRSNIRLASVVVTALVVGLVVGLMVGRGTAEAPVVEPPPGLAGDDVLAMLADRVETLNTDVSITLTLATDHPTAVAMASRESGMGAQLILRRS